MRECVIQDENPLPMPSEKVRQYGTGQSVSYDKKIDHVIESIHEQVSSCEQNFSMTMYEE